MKRYMDYISAYANSVGNLIKVLNLPLGYRCFAISMDMETILLYENEGSYILPKKNHFLGSEAALKIRSLIKDALNVKEGNEGR